MPFMKKIVLVDDDEDDRFIFSEGFSQSGYEGELIQFESGSSFLSYLNTNQDDYPSLILLDLNMPLIGGMELLKQLKSDKHWQSIPIVILTTSKLEEDKNDSYAHGANGFITKPGDYQSVLNLVQSIIYLWGN